MPRSPFDLGRGTRGREADLAAGASATNQRPGAAGPSGCSPGPSASWNLARNDVAHGPCLFCTLPEVLGRHSDLADETCGPDRHSCDPAAEPQCCTPQKLWQVAPIFPFPAVVAASSGEDICGRLSGVLRPGEGTRRVPDDLGRTGQPLSSQQNRGGNQTTIPSLHLIRLTFTCFPGRSGPHTSRPACDRR